MTSKKIAVFPGSFDPITHGHCEVIKAALKVFDHVVVGIGLSSSKKALFSDQERVQMIQKVFAEDTRVSAVTFSGLAVEFAKQSQACALIRGLRMEADFAYEMPMALINKKLDDEILTVFFPTASELAYVSSSVVKEIAQYGGNIAPFVPEAVRAALQRKLH